MNYELKQEPDTQMDVSNVLTQLISMQLFSGLSTWFLSFENGCKMTSFFVALIFPYNDDVLLAKKGVAPQATTTVDLTNGFSRSNKI